MADLQRRTLKYFSNLNMSRISINSSSNLQHFFVCCFFRLSQLEGGQYLMMWRWLMLYERKLMSYLFIRMLNQMHWSSLVINAGFQLPFVSRLLWRIKRNFRDDVVLIFVLVRIYSVVGQNFKDVFFFLFTATISKNISLACYCYKIVFRTDFVAKANYLAFHSISKLVFFKIMFDLLQINLSSSSHEELIYRCLWN